MRIFGIGFGAVFGTIFLSAAGIIGYGIHQSVKYENSETREVTAKVINTTMTVKDGQSVPLVHTDKGIFANFDDPLKGKFNQANAIQGQIRNDSTYKFSVYGFESSMTAVYPNILSAVPVRSGQ
jgi:hypothetical protein